MEGELGCQEGGFGRWDSCTKTCGGGIQISRRRIRNQLVGTSLLSILKCLLQSILRVNEAVDRNEAHLLAVLPNDDGSVEPLLHCEHI